MKQVFIFLFLGLLLTACKQVQKVTDLIVQPTSREVFERELAANDTAYQRYEHQYQQAKSNTLSLPVPSTLHARSDSTAFKILAYTVELEHGQRFSIESDVNADSLQLHLDVFSFKNDSLISIIPLISNEPNNNSLHFNVTKSGLYKIVVLPALKSNVNFGIKLFTQPTLAFPVSGKDNRAIQSYWGAVRAGGKRSHEGIDIFAKRGTPVIAVTKGYVSSTGNRGLGGKQVWLRDGIFGQSLYYAHLDSIAVSSGKRVQVGDTLGFVGNSGNAITTRPHLHFGIYTSSGAINPYPFVKITDSVVLKKQAINSNGLTLLRKNELREGTTVKTKKLQDLAAETKVEILSKTKRWFHLKVNDSLQGFMHESLIKTGI